ncbi:class I SAM-dependent methyltransferase [Leifsonia sp. F6_8S_P_1B]|uniref:Class I SAM-dependent methyltransferase n=1 Tax=Leifsonia williamsii TaxID=3035919 RepID=A0ABT8K9I4_9MICO|nr:class I SAM-dependent methyltransferase [Leifsonia williamsii]MDN4614110.1 class I SAM-dependent methyltransferase [Leifsonia williamsii]
MTRLLLPADLSPVERSALLPILGRARDAAGSSPILDDRWSRTVVDSLAVDWDGLGLPRKESATVATRGRLIDDACRAFLAAHPDAVVLDLGSGLDDRAQRVAPPAGVLWLDLDLPHIMALRRRLPGRPGVAADHREVEADAASGDWLSEIPADRPLIALADGFFPFLPPAISRSLVERLVDRVPDGELVMNGYTTLARSLMPRVKAIRDLGIDTAGGTAFDDPREPEAWHPRLRLIDRTMLSRSAYVERMPRSVRAGIRMMNALPRLADRSDLGVLRFAF